jgi:NADH:ubiquinone oxidoreductase subunit 2 (subunit N)
VLILLPSRRNIPATSAETFDDLAGLGHKHLVLALAMSVSCFSLIGLPLTVGFFGKLYLIAPAFKAGLNGLVIILVLNAAISAAYYLKIVAALFLRPEPPPTRFGATPVKARQPIHYPIPVLVSIGVSMVGVLWLGIVLPATQRLTTRTMVASQMVRPPLP